MNFITLKVPWFNKISVYWPENDVNFTIQTLSKLWLSNDNNNNRLLIQECIDKYDLKTNITVDYGPRVIPYKQIIEEFKHIFYNDYKNIEPKDIWDRFCQFMFCDCQQRCNRGEYKFLEEYPELDDIKYHLMYFFPHDLWWLLNIPKRPNISKFTDVARVIKDLLNFFWIKYREWFNEEWIHKDTWNYYDKEGFDIFWYNKEWYSSAWYNIAWNDKNGFNYNWYNQKWFYINGIHKKTGTKYNEEWYDINYLNKDWNEQEIIF